MRLLLVEDDPDLRRLLRDSLVEAGFAVDKCRTNSAKVHIQVGHHVDGQVDFRQVQAGFRHQSIRVGLRLSSNAARTIQRHSGQRLHGAIATQGLL